ncbi:MAG: nucleotidyltransferase family protein [Clostridia bacterium]|nr:nucleotidyltransferase family protein [Clostridia bacterium]
MYTAAVIAEYNPFHNGHAYHLQKTRAAGVDAVIAVMSGSFVQRGEPAAFSKWARAEAAVRCGADLVLELPVYWATAGAQRFAQGAVSVVKHTGLAQMLSFGSECGDADRIARAARIVDNLKIPESLLRSGMLFAKAREEAVRALDSEAAELLRMPNDTLAVEYAVAAERCGFRTELLAVKRIGMHDGVPESGFASASHIRANLSSPDVLSYCPAQSAEVLCREMRDGRAPASLRCMERALILRLRSMSAEQIARLPDVSEGLENRILDAAKRASSMEELLASAKTKRYSHARLRRIVLSALLRIDSADIPQDVPYLRVLAIGRRGKELLHEMKQTADIPIITNPSQIDGSDDAAARTFLAEYRASEVYAMLLPRIIPSGSERTQPVFVLP